MTDPLRKAAEMALKVLEHSLGYSKEAQARINEAKQALRQALAQITCPPCTHDCNEGRDCPARKAQP